MAHGGNRVGRGHTPPPTDSGAGLRAPLQRQRACDAAAGRAAGRTYVTASAGNHGLSVAAGAAAFGARARIYIAETVPEAFAERLRAFGAEVRREGNVYEQSMAAAARDAALAGGAHFLSTDYYEPSPYFDSPYAGALPDGRVARCNPVTAPSACSDALLTEP